MAKLVEILARELKEWPEGVEDISQGHSGNLYDHRGEQFGFVESLADDRSFAIVCRSEWEAELAAIACGKRSAEDQALWDKVAIAAIQAMASSQGANDDRKQWMGYISEDACDIADAFMAERAKRMKGESK